MWQGYDLFSLGNHRWIGTVNLHMCTLLGHVCLKSRSFITGECKPEGIHSGCIPPTILQMPEPRFEGNWNLVNHGGEKDKQLNQKLVSCVASEA